MHSQLPRPPQKKQARSNLEIAGLLLAALLLIACQPRGVRPDSLSSHFPVQQQASTAQVTALLARQPIDQNRLEPTRHYQGAPGWALAPGTVVRRLSLEDPQILASSLGGKVDQARHPWIYVEVVQAPLEAHQGRSGWIHVEDLARAGDNRQPFSLSALRADLLAQKAWLCAHPERSPEPGKNCAISLHPDLPLHHLGCQQGFAQVELWDPDGKYVAGFVRGEAFTNNPCASSP